MCEEESDARKQKENINKYDLKLHECGLQSTSKAKTPTRSLRNANDCVRAPSCLRGNPEFFSVPPMSRCEKVQLAL